MLVTRAVIRTFVPAAAVTVSRTLPPLRASPAFGFTSGAGEADGEGVGVATAGWTTVHVQVASALGAPWIPIARARIV